MVCTKCSADNPSDNKFCRECGGQFIAVAPVPVAGEDGAWYCARHTKTVTRLRCGRCETPICPKCTVQAPGGIRCRACARHKIRVRPAGVLHEAGRAVEGAASRYGNRVWYLALWYFILSLFGHGEP